ncbi:hypothetical protein GCM10022221_24070 [Actinocorallia aurea]
MASEARVDTTPFGPVVHPDFPSGMVLLRLSAAEDAGLEAAGRLSALTGATVVCGRFRPVYPAALQDAQAAYQYSRTLGSVVVAGERLAAGLAASLLVRLRDLGAPMPRAAILTSAVLDLTLDAPSIAVKAGADPAYDAAALRAEAKAYAAGASPADPLLSPLFANLHGLPPVQLLVAGTDPFIDDSLAFSAQAARSAVPVELRVLPDSAHLGHRSPGATAAFMAGFAARLPTSS